MYKLNKLGISYFKKMSLCTILFRGLWSPIKNLFVSHASLGKKQRCPMASIVEAVFETSVEESVTSAVETAVENAVEDVVEETVEESMENAVEEVSV